MAWFLRAIERDDSRWVCRWGQHEFDSHAEAEAAIAHLREIARGIGPCSIFLHPLDGTVEELGEA